MGKYKYTVRAELDWLEEDIRIINDILEGKEPNVNNYTQTQLRDRLRYANNEIARIMTWMREGAK